MWSVSPTDEDGRVEVALDLHELSGQLVGMARAALPHEVCGLLVGPVPIDWDGRDPIAVSGVERVRNADRISNALRTRPRIDAERRAGN